MNLQEYISSGLLEAYVLGALPEAECAQVAADVARYPELAAEVAVLEATLGDMARATAVPPPLAMEDKIWTAIQAQSNRPAANVVAPIANKTIELTGSKTRSFMPRWASAAAVAALVISLIGNYVYWNANKNLEATNQSLAANLKSVQDSSTAMSHRLASYQHANDMMAKPSTRMVMMHSMQPGHEMGGMILWDTSSKQVAMMVNKMPPPPAGKQYQLWVIQGKTPVSLGVLPLNMQPSDMKMADGVASGDAFAVSLEKEGGSPTPDMQQIYVLGTVHQG